MKWVYLPIMFGLAFIYTKFSFNDFNKPVTGSYFGNKIGRVPASVPSGSLKPHPMRRVPASVLFKNLDDSNFLGVFQKVSEFKGTIIGNPHVESFGFVVDDKSRVMFSLNDFQDASEGILMHDVLAHLVSAKSLDKKISWINYFEAYKNGLQDQPHVYSYYVEKGMEEAVWETQKNFEENVTSDFPFEFTGLKKTHHHVDSVKKGIIHNSLKKKYSKIQFFDLYESNGEEKSYQMLVRVRPQDKIQWLELRESTICDYDQTFNQEAKSIPFERRFELLKTNVFDGKLEKSLDAVSMDKKYYTMKFADQFSAKLTMSQIPSDDYQDIVFDEAYVLGKIHRRALGERAEDYIKAWATIPGAVVDEKVIELKYRLKDLQE